MINKQISFFKESVVYCDAMRFRGYRFGELFLHRNSICKKPQKGIIKVPNQVLFDEYVALFVLKLTGKSADINVN